MEWGTPIRFPSVDVVSIGAGGGSIAWLDAAGYPRSGPHSAGAAPGPASYGLGGVEPTTTDAHLVLGRLSNDRFLEGAMELDAELAARAIDSRIAEPLGLSTEAAAEGILRIANATMAKAIRLVTVEQGLDPRDFSLIAFGGAGGLHAVDLARDLGMREVILPAYPGLMSAYGLLFVDPVDDFSWAYVREVSAIDIAELGALLGSLRDRVVRNLVQQGVDESSIEVGASVDLRYLGQLHTITVPLAGARRTALDEAVAGFHGQHREEFGYAAPGNPSRAPRCACPRAAHGRSRRSALSRQAAIARRASARAPSIWERRAGSRRRSSTGPTYRRETASRLRVWWRPSIRRSSYRRARADGSTTPATWSSTSRLARAAESRMATASEHGARIDPITFEVMRNAFMSVVDEMGLTLERVAHSPVVSDGRDFSAAICDGAGRLIAEGRENLPAHVGTLPHTAKAVLAWIGEEHLQPGDIVVMNDAFLGGTHAQDVRLIMPLFRDGRLLAFVQNSAHWSDAGGPVPGSFHAQARDTYGEALYITPIHLVRRGELDEALLRFVLRNVRVPEVTRGDVMAQIAACRTATTASRRSSTTTASISCSGRWKS